MAKKLTSEDVKQVEQNRQTGKLEKNVPPHWKSQVLAFEWWEPAPDGFCSGPTSKPLQNPKR